MIYIVHIDFDDARVRDDMLAWLQRVHIQDVLEAGAEDAQITVMRDGSIALEIRYTFATREDFAAYERDHAPRLRAEGIEFLAGRTARFTRSTSDET